MPDITALEDISPAIFWREAARRLKLVDHDMPFTEDNTLAMTAEAPLILYPITPSLPPGLYIRTFAPPKPGMIAAFHAPEAAKHYKASIGEHVHDDFLFMKPIVAGQGDHVCNQRNGSYVDGNLISTAATYGRHARFLPRWQGCRYMLNGDYFVMSTHVRNSFDSRHFGPIGLGQILGVYRSLIVDESRPCH